MSHFVPDCGIRCARVVYTDKHKGCQINGLTALYRLRNSQVSAVGCAGACGQNLRGKKRSRNDRRRSGDAGGTPAPARPTRAEAVTPPRTAHGGGLVIRREKLFTGSTAINRGVIPHRGGIGSTALFIEVLLTRSSRRARSPPPPPPPPPRARAGAGARSGSRDIVTVGAPPLSARDFDSARASLSYRPQLVVFRDGPRASAIDVDTLATIALSESAGSCAPIKYRIASVPN
ncbi:hypothetical protein EVAR_19850_1 [Eumeta japonica]|uniref:Uncharacterized protein n=1 Tax=Eumeta variegata TaxID=151549 RepID=A0A4C1UQT8_EUMVA|nr:hypothetical protein EVAR_19850_1 [Eumeta japonica]